MRGRGIDLRRRRWVFGCRCGRCWWVWGATLSVGCRLEGWLAVREAPWAGISGSWGLLKILGSDVAGGCVVGGDELAEVWVDGW